MVPKVDVHLQLEEYGEGPIWKSTTRWKIKLAEWLLKGLITWELWKDRRRRDVQ